MMPLTYFGYAWDDGLLILFLLPPQPPLSSSMLDDLSKAAPTKSCCVMSKYLLNRNTVPDTIDGVANPVTTLEAFPSAKVERWGTIITTARPKDETVLGRHHVLLHVMTIERRPAIDGKDCD